MRSSSRARRVARSSAVFFSLLLVPLLSRAIANVNHDALLIPNKKRVSSFEVTSRRRFQQVPLKSLFVRPKLTLPRMKSCTLESLLGVRGGGDVDGKARSYSVRGGSDRGYGYDYDDRGDSRGSGSSRYVYDYDEGTTKSSSRPDYDDNYYGGSERDQYGDSSRGSGRRSGYYDEDGYYREDDYGGYDDRGRSAPSSRSYSSGSSSLSNVPDMLRKGNRKVGLALLSSGAVLTMLGVTLFFNKNLLRMGNFLFIAGIPMTIGPGRTAGYFLQPKKARATGCLIAGIFLVLIGWPIFGIALEIFGLLNLFGNMFPVLMVLLRQVPLVGGLFGVNGNNNKSRGESRKKRSGSRSDIDRYSDDRYYGDDRYTYGDDRYSDRYYGEREGDEGAERYY